MAINLKGRSFLTLEDFTPAEIRYLLDLGHDLKAKRRAGIERRMQSVRHTIWRLYGWRILMPEGIIILREF